ncbi:uncharacterized protein LOC129750092 isoform X2 [Uranotaenia lowii]|uniref:uncharacterized protein LOC129750092 isoform X2 n=1 Tax=Uranotaenia lowii TaxID=190385 RepID=UPI0024797C7F|nr:uncharacterized protein LOC129750092 isoform X2 [Uranotaenia lowii]
MDYIKLSLIVIFVNAIQAIPMHQSEQHNIIAINAPEKSEPDERFVKLAASVREMVQCIQEVAKPESTTKTPSFGDLLCSRTHETVECYDGFFEGVLMSIGEENITEAKSVVKKAFFRISESLCKNDVFRDPNFRLLTLKFKLRQRECNMTDIVLRNGFTNWDSSVCEEMEQSRLCVLSEFEEEDPVQVIWSDLVNAVTQPFMEQNHCQTALR